MYNLEELNRISDRVEEITKEVNIIATRVDENSQRIVKVAKDMKAMERIIQKIVLSVRAEETVNHVRDLTFNASRLVFEYSQNMNAYFDGLSRMTENRPSPMIVKKKQVKETFQRLVKNARSKGLEPVVDHWTEVFNVDISTFFRKGRLMAIIHVPLKSPDKMMLSKYINSPLRVGNMAFHVELEENIIAINQEETLVRVYKEKELQERSVRNGFYHCPNSQVLSKALDKNCLYMLYKSNSYGIRVSCDLKVSRTASGV